MALGGEWVLDSYNQYVKCEFIEVHEDGVFKHAVHMAPENAIVFANAIIEKANELLDNQSGVAAKLEHFLRWFVKGTSLEASINVKPIVDKYLSGLPRFSK